MFDIGWSELLLIAVVAIVVIGPKDLPYALRTAGQWMARARALARDFQGHVDDLMREAEIDGLKRDFNNMTRTPELDGLESELMTGEMPTAAKPAAIVSTAAPAVAAVASAAAAPAVADDASETEAALPVDTAAPSVPPAP